MSRFETAQSRGINEATASEGYRISRLKSIDRGEPISGVDFALYSKALVQFGGIAEDEADVTSQALRQRYQSTQGNSPIRFAIEATVVGFCTDLLRIRPGLESIITEEAQLEPVT